MKFQAVLNAFTPKTLNIIVLILGVLVLAAVLYYSCANREGFDGSVPSASQTSAIPADTPGATTSNPTVTKPETKDIQAALDELEAFFILAATFEYKQSKLPVETRYSIAMYRTLSTQLRDELKKALETPEKSELTLRDVTDLRKKLTELSQIIRSYTQNLSPNAQQLEQQPVGTLSPEEEAMLIKSIQGYMDKLLSFDVDKLKTSNVDTDTQLKIAYYASMGQSYLNDVSSKTVTVDDAQYLKKTYQELSAVLDSVSGTTPTARAVPSYEATVVAGTPGVITLKELQNLVSRIDSEQLRLANLRSSSATLLARKTQLEKLAADVRELIGAVERKEMKLEDVPISSSSAEAFLKQMEANAYLPPLIEPRAKIADGIQAHVTPTPKPGMDVKALHGLLENAKYLKWNLEVKLEYDPKYAARDNVLKRLEAIEQRLSALAVSETPISKEMYEVFMKELQTINTSIAPEGHESSKHKYERPATAYTRITDNGPVADYPSADQMGIATSVRDSASGNAILNPPNQVSPDVFIRPGFVMNDETIQRRASASAFDDSIVGGPDYKKRSQELCRQIRGANLGEPDKFGCITNPDTVGPDYSWKGNFTMVCNRLGDTWGGWYPEMFGCPKYDPTQKFKATMM